MPVPAVPCVLSVCISTGSGFDAETAAPPTSGTLCVAIVPSPF